MMFFVNTILGSKIDLEVRQRSQEPIERHRKTESFPVGPIKDNYTCNYVTITGHIAYFNIIIDVLPDVILSDIVYFTNRTFNLLMMYNAYTYNIYIGRL